MISEDPALHVFEFPANCL